MEFCPPNINGLQLEPHAKKTRKKNIIGSYQNPYQIHQSMQPNRSEMLGCAGLQAGDLLEFGIPLLK